MVRHIFADFLRDERVYAQTERYWLDLWNGVDPQDRDDNGWKQPWFQPLPPGLSEGNPIFSAFSPNLKRGIRILQSEPTEKGIEFYAYPDTFGGTIFDPAAIHELVISCALSDIVSHLAMSLIHPWVAGKSISFDSYEGGMVSMDRLPQVRSFNGILLPNAA